MRLVACTVWILAVLVALATFDSLPDPPATSPRAAACKVLHLRDYAGETVMRRGASLVAPEPLPASFVAAETCEFCRPCDCLVLTGQVADSSPPAPRIGRKPTFQS